MITHLGHAAVRVSDLEASLRFYVDVLGLREAFRLYTPEGATATVYLIIAPHQFLELFPNGKRRVEIDGATIGLAHLCLEVEDIEAAYAAVKERGAPLDTGIITGKAKCLQFWTHDPDGNRVELMALPPESYQAQAAARLFPDA